jgi:hypothetical protein
MLPLILIVILSIGFIEGLDPYKGLLFSYYFYTFNKIRQSYLVPLVSSLFYYLLGSLAAIFFSFNNTYLVRIVLFSLLLVHIVIKVIMGKVLHYTGNMKPSLINVVKWAFINSIIQMNLILFIALSYLFKLSFVIIILTTIVIKEVLFILSVKLNKRIMLILTNYNFDYIYSLAVLILSIILLL